MVIVYMKSVYIYITSLGPFSEILYIQLYTSNKMNTLAVTFGTLDIGIISPH